MRLYLVRHAQSEANAGLPGASRDCALTELGRRQAQAVAQRLARHRIDRVLASPYVRTLETAEAIRAGHRGPGDRRPPAARAPGAPLRGGRLAPPLPRRAGRALPGLRPPPGLRLRPPLARRPGDRGGRLAPGGAGGDGAVAHLRRRSGWRPAGAPRPGHPRLPHRQARPRGPRPLDLARGRRAAPDRQRQHQQRGVLPGLPPAAGPQPRGAPCVAARGTSRARALRAGSALRSRRRPRVPAIR